jgi:hypothetical protein
MEKRKPKLIEIRPAERRDPIYIEVTEVEGEASLTQAGGKVSFEDMLQKVTPMCESVIKNFKDLTVKPDSASAEFGLKISAEGNLFIAKASGQASFKVTLDWSFK